MKESTTLLGGGRIRKVGGWKPEPLWRRDARDRFFLPKPRTLLPAIDIAEMSAIPVFDQLDVGSCVANATCTAAAFSVFKATGKIQIFSRLFMYAMTRILEGTPLNDDSGLYIPDAFKSLRKDGVCYEDTWPYGYGHDRFSVQPTGQAIAEAEQHQGLFYYRCPSIYSIKCSVEQGWPIVFGTAVPTDVEDDGEFRLPGKGAGFSGGHSMLIKGYDDRHVMKDGTVGAFRVRNSWGSEWSGAGCDPGEGWVAYGLFDRGYATDGTTLRGVELPEETKP